MDTRIAHDGIWTRELIDQLLSRMPTHCPGIIQSFDFTTGLATVAPAIKMKIIVDNKVVFLPLPKIIKCPVDLPFAQVAGFALTIPVMAGDSCNIHFSQRCIDNWLVNGVVSEPEDVAGSPRHHSLTDAIVTVGPSPLTAVLTDWLTTGIELRNRSRSVRISLTDSGIEINGTVSFLGDATFHGAMIDKNGIDHTTHQHPVPGITPGSSTTTSGAPTI